MWVFPELPILRGARMTATIYCLRCPETQEARYVGCTEKSALERMTKHLARAFRDEGHNAEKAEWLRKLVRRREYPIVDILETCPSDVRVEREEAWCRHLLDRGASLLNGAYGRALSPKARAKMSKSAKEREPNRLGETHSQETKEELAFKATVQTATKWGRWDLAERCGPVESRQRWLNDCDSSEAATKLWQQDDYRRKQFISRFLRSDLNPTKQRLAKMVGEY